MLFTYLCKLGLKGSTKNQVIAYFYLFIAHLFTSLCFIGPQQESANYFFALKVTILC